MSAEFLAPETARPVSATPVGRLRLRTLVLPQVVVLGVALLLQPVADRQLGGAPSFVPATLALAGCFDLLSAVLLVRQFLDFGDRRVLALSSAYMTSLVVLAGYAAAFPGVLGQRPPLGANLSTAPWLWVSWHTVFPVLLGAALAPWPARWRNAVAADCRRRLAWTATTGCVLGGLAVVAFFVAVDHDLPVLIRGRDISGVARTAGPVMLPLVIAGTALAVAGAWRHGGLERWAALAATTALGDVVLTLFSTYRYSVGWYAGRTLTVVSSGVVLVALLTEFSSVKRRLAEEGERLRATLARTDALERLQHTLLANMADGVIMQRSCGQVVASNPAAQQMLGLTGGQLTGEVPVDPRWRLLTPHGTLRSPNLAEETLRTGVTKRDQIVGVNTADGRVQWISVNTAAARDAIGSVDYTISSMTDVTQGHAAHLAATLEREHARDRIEDVLRRGSLRMVFQPIVNLTTGHVVGTEALARFPGPPPRSPALWFAEAADVGLGTELELAAIRAALHALDQLPAQVYLSLNASPETAISVELAELLHDAPAHRIVLELTEHAGVEDYTTLDDSLRRLRGRGIRLAVDDAGAGFASLRHILNLRPDLIKLDGALTRGMHTDPARRALAAALLTFGGEIGAQIVAEGIESEAELTVLQQLGIEHGQGYLLGRPTTLPMPSLAPAIDSRGALVDLPVRSAQCDGARFSTASWPAQGRDFSADAQAEAARDGAPPIDLIDGEQSPGR